MNAFQYNIQQHKEQNTRICTRLIQREVTKFVASRPCIWCYLVSRYGESIFRYTILSIVRVFRSWHIRRDQRYFHSKVRHGAHGRNPETTNASNEWILHFPWGIIWSISRGIKQIPYEIFLLHMPRDSRTSTLISTVHVAHWLIAFRHKNLGQN